MVERKKFANELDASFVSKLVNEGNAKVIRINSNVHFSTNSGSLLLYLLENTLYLPNYNNSEFYKVEYMELETNGKIPDDCKLELTVARNDDKYEKISQTHLSHKDTTQKLEKLVKQNQVELYNKATSTKLSTQSVMQEPMRRQSPIRPVRKNTQNQTISSENQSKKIQATRNNVQATATNNATETEGEKSFNFSSVRDYIENLETEKKNVNPDTNGNENPTSNLVSTQPEKQDTASAENATAEQITATASPKTTPADENKFKQVGKPEDYDLKSDEEIFEDSNEIKNPDPQKAEQEKTQEPVPSNQIEEKKPASEKKPAKKSEIKLWKDTFKDITTKGFQAVGVAVVVMVLMGAFAPVAIPFALVFGVLLMGYSGDLLGALEKLAKGIGGLIANHNERKALKKEYQKIQEANPNIIFKKKTRKEKRKEKKDAKNILKQKAKTEKNEAKEQKRSIKNQAYKQKQQNKIDKKEQVSAVSTDSKTIRNEIIKKAYPELQKENQTEILNKTQKRGDFILAGENEDTLQRTYSEKGKQGIIINKKGYPQIGMPAKHKDITNKKHDQTPSTYDEYFDSLKTKPKDIDFDSLIKTATKNNSQNKNIDLGQNM